MAEDPSLWVYKGSPNVDPYRHEDERRRNGFSVYDFWNFHSYMSWVNIQALRKFRAERSGYPSELDEESWSVILGQMIAGFEADLAIVESAYNSAEEAQQLDRTRQRGLELYAKWFPSLWD